MEKDSTGITTALLVMDIQPGIIARLGDSQTLLAALSGAIAKARAARVPIIFVTVGFRKGTPEVSPDNKSFSTIKQNLAYRQSLEEPLSIHPAIALQPNDIRVTKRRVSAFTGSDLEVILRAHRIRHLVLTGVSTSGVVLSTLRQAADMDYQLTVLADCCADPDSEVHRVLLEKVFPRQADVIHSGEWSTPATTGQY